MPGLEITAGQRSLTGDIHHMTAQNALATISLTAGIYKNQISRASKFFKSLIILYTFVFFTPLYNLYNSKMNVDWMTKHIYQSDYDTFTSKFR